MYSLKPRYYGSSIVFFSLLILLYLTAAPNRHWAKAPAAVQCRTITLNPATLPMGTTGTDYSQTFSATGGTAPYIFGAQASALPPGLSLARNGNLRGTPTMAGSYSFIVHANDENGCFGERSYTLVVKKPVCPTITVNPANLPLFRIGRADSHTFSATGGTAPYSFSIASGALPPELTLAANGNLNGAPTTANSYTFTVRAMDANGCTGERSYTVSVLPCEGVTLSPAAVSLPGGQINTPYSQIIRAAGGTAPYTFSLNTGSSLPPGLTLSTSGVIEGTPTTGGSFSFRITATSANGCVGSGLYVIPINCMTTLNPTDPALPAATVGTPYGVTFSLTGGGVPPFTFSLVGMPPPGLTLNGSTGVLSGSPTQAGNFSFIITVSDPNRCSENRLYTVAVNNPVCPTITINPPGILSGRVGVAYSFSFNASGGQLPYTYSISGTLPSGLTFSSPNLITGTPTAAGNYNITARATDANGCTGERTYTLEIFNPNCPAIDIAPTTLSAGTTGTMYNQTFTSSGGTAPYSFTITAGLLPAELSLATNGVLSGTPTTASNYIFTVRATDANGCSGSRIYTLVINNPACPTITVNPTNTALPAGTTGATYNQTLTVTGGASPYAYSISTGALPTGLSLASNGDLAGTPTSAGNYSFKIQATDANGCTGERGYTLVINNPACPAITVNPAGLSNGTVGAAYSQAIAATGGASPYSFAISAGALPAGLALNATTGAITGTPTSADVVNFTVRATDANGCMGERAYTVVIAAVVNAVTSVSAASFAANSPLATESIAAAFGSNLATSTEIASTLPLPTELAGVSLKVKDSAGMERLAPLFFVSPTQINYQIPPGTAVGPAGVTVTNGIDVTAAGAVEIASVSPGLFSADASGQGIAAAIVLRVKENGTQSYEAVARYDAVQNRFVAEPIDLGSGGDQLFLVLYGTGLKFRSALSAVSCSIGGESSEVLFAGEVPGFVGLDQINARLSSALAGRGEVDVVISVDGKAANTLRVAIR